MTGEVGVGNIRYGAISVIVDLLQCEKKNVRNTVYMQPTISVSDFCAEEDFRVE